MIINEIQLPEHHEHQFYLESIDKLKQAALALSKDGTFIITTITHVRARNGSYQEKPMLSISFPPQQKLPEGHTQFIGSNDVNLARNIILESLKD